MMKQMLLAQMLSEGAEATQNSSALPWGTWVSSVIGLLGSIIVAWWSGRKIDKQMELSKQATPPELTRYKTWLEVSEVFKKLEGAKDLGTLADSEEYQEIEASRKVALERAVWERKVISECSNIQAQKLVMEIPESKIYEIHNPDIYRGIELSVDSYIKPKASGILWLIPLSMLSLFPILTVIILGGNSGDREFAVIFLLVMPILLFPMFRHLAPNQYSGIFEANYFLRKTRVEVLLERRKSNDVNNCEPIFHKVDKYWEKWYRREGLRYASFYNTWAKNIHCPWEGKCWAGRVWHKVWCYFFPGIYVRTIFKPNILKAWGSYKEESLNVDLSQKNKDSSSELHGNKDAQSLKSDALEESDPTPPQR